MSFFKRPIITGDWHTNTDIGTLGFKAFQKPNNTVEIKIYRKRVFVDDDLNTSISMNNNEFYNNFVSILNTDQPLILKGNAKTGKWSCDPEDKANVLRSMPAEGEMEEHQSAGGKHRHHKKRKSHKRSGKKRSGHKRSKSHKRSGHKSRRH
jgi:hypothetical protein